MIIEDVMDEIGDQLETISGLNVLPYEADDVSPPAALISLPAMINYQSTYARGINEIDILVTVLVGMVGDKVRRKEIAPFADSSGAKSVVTKLEAHNGSYTAFSSIQVRTGVFAIINIAQVDWLAAIFSCHILGRG